VEVKYVEEDNDLTEDSDDEAYFANVQAVLPLSPRLRPYSVPDLDKTVFARLQPSLLPFSQTEMNIDLPRIPIPSQTTNEDTNTSPQASYGRRGAGVARVRQARGGRLLVDLHPFRKRIRLGSAPVESEKLPETNTRPSVLFPGRPALAEAFNFKSLLLTLPPPASSSSFMSNGLHRQRQQLLGTL
jgi:hypothetical protein